MGTLGKTTITDLSVYNTIHGKIEQADKVTIEPGSSDNWRNMLVTTGENDIFSVPNVYANYSLGALKAKTLYITGSANNTTAHISSDTTTNMYFSLRGVIPLVIDTSSTTNPIIRPSTSLKGAADLGSSSCTWRNVYSNLLTTNRLITGGDGNAVCHIKGVTSTVDYTHIYSANADGSSTTRPLILQTGYGNVGIGTATPTEKLEVNGNIKATSFTGNVTGNATSSTKTGDGTNILYAEKQNEINFGGTSNSGTIYFGYRATDSKPIPSKFVFGSSGGTAELLAKTYKKTDGTEVSYNGHTHTFLGLGGAQLSATTRNLTNFPTSKTLFTGYWGSETDTLGYNTRYGTTLDISYYTWYQRLAFSTSGRIEYFRGINTNNSDNTEATLAKIGDLAYTSDIPTNVSQLTNDAGYTTASGHTHSYLPLSGGTLTGPLVLNGTDTDRNVIRINCESGGANNTGAWGYTLKFLGSGSGVNNALALYADNSTATTQVLATKWLNDGTMYGRNILPHTNNTFDLGSSSLQWNNICGKTLYENGTSLVDKYAAKSHTHSYVLLTDTDIDNMFRDYFGITF